MPAERNAKGQFVKGNTCGTGRRRQPPEFREAVMTLAPEALSTVAEIMRDVGAEPQHRLAASKLIIEHAYGKPRQAVDLWENRDALARLDKLIEEIGHAAER